MPQKSGEQVLILGEQVPLRSGEILQKTVSTKLVKCVGRDFGECVSPHHCIVIMSQLFGSFQEKQMLENE